MWIIKNTLAAIGLIALVLVGLAAAKVWPALKQFDPEALGVYRQFATTLLETKDPGVAMMYSIPVEEGLSPEEVKESMISLATGRNFLYTGEAPFYKQVEAVTGEPYRYVNFLSFCDARVGKMMADYRDAYTGFMPCRIAIVEDQAGRVWLHSMNLDMMIHGGKALPPELKSEALRVWANIKGIMASAAAGEF